MRWPSREPSSTCAVDDMFSCPPATISSASPHLIACVASIAAAYREQVLLDYGCFTDYVRSNFSIGPSNYLAKNPDDDDDDEVEFD